ncbi:MAG: hypothetical protein ABSB28_11720 [Candidatus Bathyarchaeia archaeon]
MRETTSPLRGYDQHASHTQLNADISTAEVFTVLWEMRKKERRGVAGDVSTASGVKASMLAF